MSHVKIKISTRIIYGCHDYFQTNVTHFASWAKMKNLAVFLHLMGWRVIPNQQMKEHGMSNSTKNIISLKTSIIN